YVIVISFTFSPQRRFAKWISARHSISTSNWKKPVYTENPTGSRVKTSQKAGYSGDALYGLLINVGSRGTEK
ncbi:hypothetical protein, partial [Serratia bockelmannii]|uniref:hypothetical protein n=1 Tax=Serratia bockelmannii TaxID=2703793 RepID=UPI003FA71CF8